MLKANAPVLPGRSKMNKTEEAYAQVLEARLRSGQIRMWEFQGMKLRLADGAYYTPDFFVVTVDDLIELHETKGFMREAARVRLLVAASKYPFTFKLVRKVKGLFSISDVKF